MKLDGKAALISGGGTGIGAAIARALHAEGAQVTVCGRRSEPLKALCAELGERAHWTTCDVALDGSAAAAVQAATEQWGKLDLLVNNAGVFLAKPLVEISDAEIDLLTGVNFRGLLSLSREAIPALVASKGSIVNIGSVSANRPVPGASLYAGLKAAVEHVTRCLAVELGPSGVRVNCVAPGLTETDMSAPLTQNADMLATQVAATPLGRLGTPGDIAPAVVYLASDAWVTGQVIQSSGGLWI